MRIIVDSVKTKVIFKGDLLKVNYSKEDNNFYILNVGYIEPLYEFVLYELMEEHLNDAGWSEFVVKSVIKNFRKAQDAPEDFEDEILVEYDDFYVTAKVYERLIREDECSNDIELVSLDDMDVEVSLN